MGFDEQNRKSNENKVKRDSRAKSPTGKSKNGQIIQKRKTTKVKKARKVAHTHNLN